MPVLDKLLRRHRRDRDARRRYAAQLELLAERLRADASRVRRAIAAAGGVGSEAARALVERYRKLEGSIAEIERQIAEARNAVVAAERQCERCERAVAVRSGRGLVDRRPGRGVRQ